MADSFPRRPRLSPIRALPSPTSRHKSPLLAHFEGNHRRPTKEESEGIEKRVCEKSERDEIEDIVAYSIIESTDGIHETIRAK